jgi:hypothetical protein
VTSTSSYSRSFSEEFRERLDAENSLVAQRVSWLILSQSFLFIAYTGALVARPTHAHAGQITRLLRAFPVLGLVIVAGVYVSIWAALLSIRALRRCFDSVEPHQANPFDQVPGSGVRRLGNVAAHLPPIAIGATWIWLLTTNPP